MGAHRRHIAAAVAVLALGGVAAGPAAAFRTPSPDELTAMADATGPPSDPACVSGRISTVDADWGALVARDGPSCPNVERVYVMRRAGVSARWTEYRQAPSFDVCSQGLPAIPSAVGVDLGVCKPPSRRVFVGVGARFGFKPATLPWTGHAKLTGARWSSWGGRTASGRGMFVYADRYGGFRVPVKVTLSAIGLCGSNRTYLAKRVAAVRPQDVATLRIYSGRFDVQCPGVTRVGE